VNKTADPSQIRKVVPGKPTTPGSSGFSWRIHDQNTPWNTQDHPVSPWEVVPGFSPCPVLFAFSWGTWRVLKGIQMLPREPGADPQPGRRSRTRMPVECDRKCDEAAVVQGTTGERAAAYMWVGGDHSRKFELPHCAAYCLRRVVYNGSVNRLSVVKEG